jgi:hypothetical protein
MVPIEGFGTAQWRRSVRRTAQTCVFTSFSVWCCACSSQGPRGSDEPQGTSDLPAGVAPAMMGEPSHSETPGETPPGQAPAPGPMASTPVSATGVVPNPEPELAVRAPLATRISKTEYAWSVYDVLGVELSEAELAADNGGLPDDAGDGVFKRFADKQVTFEQHAAGFWALAERVAERVNVETLRETYGACGETEASCVTSLVFSLGERLFRRPLGEREQGVYSTVAQAALDAGESFESAVKWSLTALLQAPPFVFHLLEETQGAPSEPRDLTPHELAARLASFIWSSVPDAALLDAAKDGSLTEPATLNAQVTRMLEDPKAKRMTEAFIRDYSRAERASFLDASDADRRALRESMVATFQHLTWEEKRPLGEMFTTTNFLVNERTAELLGANGAASGAGLSPLDVSSLPERVGLLTHPGVIAGMGDQEIGSFVNRGKFLMERLLCVHPAAVPAALAAALEEFTADTTGLSEHERLALRKTRLECWTCHQQFEPFALGFARFDGAGRYRGEVDEQGRPLPLDGWVPTVPESIAQKYTNVREYMEILQNEPAVQKCLTEHFLSYATSYAPDALTRRAAAQLAEAAPASEQTLVQMVSTVTRSDLFRQFVVQPTDAAEGK